MYKRQGFEHNVRSTRCGLCENHCNLTINNFGGGRRFISGNRCERPLGGTKKADLPNLYKWKLEKLRSYGEPSGNPNPIATIGLPFGLNYFELLPFWTKFLRTLGFETVISDVSTRDMYMKGQHSIPSDTVCYPAKLMHGHIENLLEKGVDAIFYPCMTYNRDEGRASNCYNCPVVAYYPELLKANVSALTDFDFMMPYFELADPKRFRKHAVRYFCKKYPQLKKKKVLEAADAAYQAQQEYCTAVRLEGQKAIRYADEHGLDAVSYTHLDVYKRQGVICSASLMRPCRSTRTSASICAITTNRTAALSCPIRTHRPAVRSRSRRSRICFSITPTA